jgi:hypothetical protein
VLAASLPVVAVTLLKHKPAAVIVSAKHAAAEQLAEMQPYIIRTTFDHLPLTLLQHEPAGNAHAGVEHRPCWAEQPVLHSNGRMYHSAEHVGTSVMLSSGHTCDAFKWAHM